MNPETPPPQNIVTLAVVIESSLTIAQEWPNPLFYYCTQLFKRISDAHHPARLRTAFVGYGTADTVPSPILCKRFFTENAMVFKEIFAAPLHFGIGMTNSGGERGMAALEGLVSALEMIDGLQNLPNTKIYGSYILHIAASPPDNSQRPLWNDSIAMDDMDWKSLPDELKKRNISYNLITLKPPQGHLLNLYTALNNNADSSTPWFDLRPSYTLLAASIVALQAQKAPQVLLNKRSSESTTNTERASDNKRPRLQEISTESPKQTPKTTPAHAPSQPPLQTPPLTQAQAQTDSQPPQPAMPHITPPIQLVSHVPAPNGPAQIRFQFPPGVSPQQILQKITEATEYLKKHDSAIQAAVAEGSLEKAEILKREYDKKRIIVERMRDSLLRQASMMSQDPLLQIGASGVSNHGQPSIDGGSISSIGNSIPMLASRPPAGLDVSQSQHGLLDTSLSTNQMQAIEQNQIAAQYSGSAQSQTSSLGFMSAKDTNNMAGPSMSSPRAEWTGVLKWSGQANGGKKEVQCIVSISSAMDAQKALTDTWPQTMSLMPTAEKFPPSELHKWVRRHQPCLCLFKAISAEPDQTNYKTLIHLLLTKQTYATASWLTPSGNNTRNIIFFPYVQENLLAGAVFPITGLPELPKMVPPLLNMSSAMAEKFNLLSPAQKQQLITQMMMLRQQQARNQQGHNTPFNPGVQSNMNAALSAMSAAHSPGNSMHMMNPTGMLSSPPGVSMSTMPSAGGTHGNLSPEMFQSFMQRHTGDGMNNGQNFGQNL